MEERQASEAAWKLAKSVQKLKEKNRAAFFSPSESRCLPASNLKCEEREFVVDSGASRSPMTVITANGEVQTHEEATVYVKELDIFLTMKLLEDTPAVLSLGKLFAMNMDIHMSGSTVKNHISFKNGIQIQCNTENFVQVVVPGLSTTPSSSSTSTSTIPSG